VPRARRTAVLLLIGAAVLAAACSSAGSSSPATPSTPTAALPGAIPTVGLLHVVTPTSGGDRTPYLADAAGRQVVLRGVAVVGLQDVAYPGAGDGPALFPVDPSAYDGTCPAASALVPQPPLCEVEASTPAYRQSTAPASGDDFAQMRALGYDAVRLVLNWSQLEPTPGNYSTTYLDRVAQVVSWAGQQGISIILDMHQDQYSRYILPEPASKGSATCPPSGGSDGAPAWAVFTDGKPACAFEGQAALNPASSAAFENFWDNHPVAGPKGESPGTGLEDHYIGALAALADRFEDDPTVIGYEIMNEPQEGSLSAVPIGNLYQASATQLYPFYKRVIEALTGVRDGLPTCPASDPTSTRCAYPQQAHVDRQSVFYEPFADRNEIDFSPQASVPFSSYPDLVYAPHIYTHAFTLDQFIGYPATDSPYPPSYTFGYQTADYEAQAMHSAVFVTEYGADAGSDSYLLTGETAAQDATETSSTLWAWKGLSDQQSSCWCVRWQQSSYNTTSNGTAGSGDPDAAPSPDDQLIPSRGAITSRVWPRATAGTLGAYRFVPGTAGTAGTAGSTPEFAMVATDASGVAPGDRGAETDVYIPGTVTGPVEVGGAARLDAVTTAPDGSRTAWVEPTGADPSGMGATDASAVGRYTVTVGTPGPATISLLSQVEASAADPLPPISEVQARQTAEAALAQAAQSQDPSIRAKAALADELASLLLGPTDPTAGS